MGLHPQEPVRRSCGSPGVRWLNLAFSRRTPHVQGMASTRALTSRVRAFVKELRRRHVVRIAVGYAISAFIALQAADLLFPALRLPDWTYSLVVGLALVGFPVALALAWAVEITPEGIRRDEGARISESAATSPRQQEDVVSVVVLPFTNLSTEPDSDWFADGLVEEIIADLSRVRALRVISRTSSMALKNTNKDVRTIGRELNVRYVLEGSVRRSRDDLRITAQLIDADTDSHLWAEKYGGSLADVFSMQERLSRSIVEALSLWLDPAERAHLEDQPVENVHAYECLLRARHELFSFSRDGLDRAVRALEQALVIEGENVVLLAMLGFVHRNRAVAGVDPTASELAEDFARRAAAVDEEDPQVLALTGLLLAARGEIGGAIRALKRSFVADPNNAAVLSELVRYLVDAGLETDAEVFADRLLSLDPLTPITYGLTGYVKWGRGDFEAALPEYRRAYEIAPDQPHTGLFYGCALARAGQREASSEVLHKTYQAFPDAALGQFARFFGSAIMGDREAALAAATPLVLEVGRSQSYLARDVGVSFGLVGENARALEWLRHTVDLGFFNYPFIAERDPLLAPLRSDPEFESVAEAARRKWVEIHEDEAASVVPRDGFRPSKAANSGL